MSRASTTATACRSAFRSSVALAATTPRLRRRCLSSAPSRRSWAASTFVIPDCREAASPESINTGRGYGFRAPRFARPRNDKSLRRGLRQRRRIVVKNGRQPPLALGERLTFAPRVIVDLIAFDLADAEIITLRMTEIEAAHRGAGPHRKAFGQFYSDRVLGIEEREQSAF